MFTDDVRMIVQSAVLCWLATVDGDGVPNVSPKEIFCAQGDDTLLIADIASPSSVSNLRLNPRVCVSLVDVFRQRGYKFKGTARLIERVSPEFDRMAPPLAELAGPDFPIRRLICVAVTTVSPILAPSYVLFPDRSEARMIANAHRLYGVVSGPDPLLPPDTGATTKT